MGVHPTPADTARFEIVLMEPVPASAAVRRWGEHGRSGAVVIRTRRAPDTSQFAVRLPQILRLLEYYGERDPAPPSSFRQVGYVPIIIVDGRVLPKAEAADLARSNSSAKRIEVFRGSTAAVLFGTRAWNGVVVACVVGDPGDIGRCN
jgi:hypothetical protein